MDRFHLIDEAACIVRSKGVYKQVKVYRRGEAIYAGVSGGFVRLYKGGGTAVPALSWDDIDLPITGGFKATDLAADAHGKLSVPPAMKLIEVSK